LKRAKNIQKPASKEEPIQIINKLISELSPSQIEKVIQGLDKNQLSDILLKKILEEKEGISSIKIPISIFQNKELGILETLIYYLKKEICLKNKQICKLLFRSSQVVWTSYDNAKKKIKKDLVVKSSEYDFFVSVIQDYNSYGCSMFESIVYYLRESYDLTYVEISNLLKRKPSTISTVYNRAKNKINE